MTTVPDTGSAQTVVELADVVKTYRGGVVALDHVSLALRRGECLGIVGESGSGKSTVARLVCGLEKPTAGVVSFDGKPIAAMSRRELRSVRSHLQIVFQDSLSSFNPRMTLGQSIAETLRMHFSRIGGPSRKRAVVSERVEVALAEVGLDADMAGRYPSEVSGGQRQRAGIARALIVEPDVVVFDEPVSALDLVSSERILSLLNELTTSRTFSSLLISHDLSVVARCAHRTAVMRGGGIVEVGPTERVLRDPATDYAAQLIAAVPRGITALESTRGKYR